MAGPDSLRPCLHPVPTARGAVVASVAVAAAGAVLVELSPLVGGDLGAQRYWGSWAASSDGRPVDLGWYAGSPAVSYSLLAAWVVALVGPAVAGAVASVVGAGATTALLARAGALRPRAAGLLAALAFLANQLSGRTTFAMGAAAGVLALLVAGRAVPTLPTRAAVLLLAVLASALSPVAGVLLGLAAAAWWVGGTRSPAASPGCRTRTRTRIRTWAAPPTGRTADVLLLLLGAAAPLLAMAGLGAAGGPMTGSAHQTAAAVLATVLVGVLVGRARPVLRAGVVLTLLLLVAVWLVPEPVGSNATRVVLLFAAPVVVAFGTADRLVVGLVAAMVTWLLPPLVTRDLAVRDTAAQEAAAAPLLAELARRGPVGRVEVVPLADHSDAALARHVPVARGWTRQLDVGRNALFYDGSLRAGSYLAWLRERGVSYVALSQQRPDWAGTAEAALVRSGVPGLTRVWSDGTWSLFAVDGPGLVLHGPAQVTASDRRALTVRIGAPGTVELAMFWDERLSLSGEGCLAPGPREGTVLVVADGPGSSTLSSAWRPTGHC